MSKNTKTEMADPDDLESRLSASNRAQLSDSKSSYVANEQTNADSKIITNGSGISTTRDSAPDSEASQSTEDSPTGHQAVTSREKTIDPDVHVTNSTSTSSKDQKLGKSQNDCVLKAMENLEKDSVEKFAIIYDDRGLEDKQIEEPSNKELSPMMAALFMVSVTTGFAMTTLPHGLKQSGWFGVFMIIVLSVNLCYAGLCHGWSWVIMEERWPKYQGESRTPYMDMAEEAVGKCMRYIVEFIQQVTLLAIGAVYIIAVANSVHSVSHDLVGFCTTLIVASIILVPFMWFRTYKDFKFLAVLDMALTLIWVSLLVASVSMDNELHMYRNFSSPTPESIALAFSDMSFAYGPGAALPSIMSDMRDRSLFSHASITACLIVVVLYSIPTILAYASYGDDTPAEFSHEHLPSSVPHSLKTATEVVFLCQIMTTFVVFVMPCMLTFEHRLRVPDSFGIKRVAMRSSIVLFVMLLVLGWPDIFRLVPILGATGMTLMAFLFPPIFYVCLVYRKDSRSTRKRSLSKKEWLLVAEMIIIGVAVLVLGTFFTVRSVFNSSKKHKSCYVNFTGNANEGNHPSDY